MLAYLASFLPCSELRTVQPKGNVALARNSTLIPQQLHTLYSSSDVHNSSVSQVANHLKRTTLLDQALPVISRAPQQVNSIAVSIFEPRPAWELDSHTYLYT